MFIKLFTSTYFTHTYTLFPRYSISSYDFWFIFFLLALCFIVYSNFLHYSIQTCYTSCIYFFS